MTRHPHDRNVVFGFWALLVFVVAGLGLELLHAFKFPAYLDVAAAPRRLMWSLAHAHGTLVALVNVAFGLTMRALPHAEAWAWRASPCLLSAAIVLPGGFFLGGLGISGGDPGPGVLVVPIGAALLIVGIACAALALRGGGRAA